MKVQNVTPNSTSFGKISCVPHCDISKNLRQTIEAAPAITRLGEFYDAKVFIQRFLTPDYKNETLGLIFLDIKPKNLLARIRGLFKKLDISEVNAHLYNSNQTSEAGFINTLTNLDKDTFLKNI